MSTLYTRFWATNAKQRWNYWCHIQCRWTIVGRLCGILGMASVFLFAWTVFWTPSHKLTTCFLLWTGYNGVELTAESTNIPLGGTIVITCRAMNGLYTSMQLNKMNPEDIQKPYVTISDNDMTAMPFKALGRYTMTHAVVDSANDLYDFTLTISREWHNK